MRRKEALYAVIGSIVGTVLTLAVCTVVPIGRQIGNDGHFDGITCRELKVVDSNGSPWVEILSEEREGKVRIWSDGNGSTFLNGGHVSVYGEDMRWYVLMSADKRRASVRVIQEEDARAIMSSDEDGGRVTVYSKDKRSKAGIDCDKDGAVVGVDDMEGKSRVRLGLSERLGGYVGLRNKYGYDRFWDSGDR